MNFDLVEFGILEFVLIDLDMKVNGRTINNMGKVKKPGQTEHATKETTQTAKNTAKEKLYSQMDHITRETSETTISMVKIQPKNSLLHLYHYPNSPQIVPKY